MPKQLLSAVYSLKPNRSKGVATQFEKKFFASDAAQVATELIGAYLWRRLPSGQLFGGRIVETEAYGGPEDLASHARFGQTVRSQKLFGPPGIAYIYKIYGMYWMLNVVTKPEGEPSAVLIRALEPTAATCANDQFCCRGPGKLCRALHISGELNGINLIDSDALWLELKTAQPKISTSTRIGVNYAGDWAAKPWRFFQTNSPFVSKQK